MVKHLAQRAAPEAVVSMRAAPVVEVQIVIEHFLHGPDAGEEAAAELHPPQLAEDGALEPFDEAVGPGVAGFGAGVPETQLPTDLIKRSPVLRALITEHPLHGPSRLREVGHNLPEELGRRLGRTRSSAAPQRTSRPCTARLCRPFQLADVEGVEADQLPGRGGVHVLGAAMLSVPQPPTCPLSEQPGGPSAVMLQDREPLQPGPQAGPAEQPVYGGRRDALAPVLGAAQLRAQAGRAQGQPGQCHRQHGLLGRPRRAAVRRGCRPSGP